MATPFGAEIRKRRERLNWSIATLRDEVCLYLPRLYWPSTEKLRRIEAGDTAEERVPFDLIAAIAQALHCSIRDIAPQAAEAAPQIKTLVGSVRNRCFAA